jgi:hypothetical protein
MFHLLIGDTFLFNKSMLKVRLHLTHRQKQGKPSGNMTCRSGSGKLYTGLFFNSFTYSGMTRLNKIIS